MIRGIIVEGTDCSGKSTLIDHLKADLSRSGWDSCDLCHRNGNQFERYLQAYANADRMLFDRGHFSEIVYGNLWRGGQHFEPWQIEYLHDIALSDFLVIFVHAPEEELVERYRSRHYGQIIEVEELSRVQRAFGSVLDDDRVIQYDAVSRDNLQKVVNRVFDRLRDLGLMGDMVKSISAEKRLDAKPRFVLLEGVNGSGKSTMAKLLKVNAVGWGVKTLDYREGSPYPRFLAEYANGTNLIFDRGHISEIVYGNLFRNGRHFSDRERRTLDELVAREAVVVFCDPSVDVIRRRVLSTTYPKHVHESRLAQLRNEFIRALDSSGIKYLTVDTDQPEAVEQTVALVSDLIGAKAYSEMGWDKPLVDTGE